MSRKQPTPPPPRNTRDGRVPDRSVTPSTPTAPPNVPWVSTVEQPKPHGSGTPISEIVARHVLDRMELGMKKYGEPLMANNGRDPLIDAYQESHDLTVYLCQALVEKYGENFEF